METTLSKALPKHLAGTSQALLTLFRSATDIIPTGHPTIGQILHGIRDLKPPDLDSLRTLYHTNREAYDEGKKKLPAVTFGGKFKGRREATLETHSGFIVLDLDNLEGILPELREDIENDRYTYACFLSPSGVGLKVIVRIEATDAKEHRRCFDGLKDYYRERFNQEIDPSGRDTSRLCFLSHDPALRISEVSEIFHLPPLPTRAKAPIRSAAITALLIDKGGIQPGDIEAVREILARVPTRPIHDEWIRVIAGVRSVLSEAESIAVLKEWSPEEKEGEYLSKLRKRLDRVTIATVVKMATPKLSTPKPLRPRLELVKAPEKQVTEEQTTTEEQKTPQLQTMSAADLMGLNIAPMQWIVPGLIPPGLMMLAGRPKGGKSWLMLHIAFAVAGGGLVFGKYQTEQAPVLYCTLEDSPRRLQTRCSAILMKGGRAPEALHFATEIRNFAAGGLGDLREWLDKYSARLIIIDTWAKARPPQKRGGNAYDDEYAATGAVHRLALERGVAIVLVHHTTKARAEDVFDEISGTTGTTAAADTLAVLRKGMDGITRELHITGRDMDQQEIALRFEPEYGSWSSLGELSELRISSERSAILDAIREAGKGLTPTAIANEIGKKPATVRKLLKTMLASELVVKNSKDDTYTLPTKEREEGGW
jgi:hypothetical protein